MTPDEVLNEFRGAGALLEGHFILSSGLHSPVFLQKALVFKNPPRTERLCKALATRIKDELGGCDLIISPAVGGIIPGYETARALGIEAIFTEREEGEFRLRRGFAVPKGVRCVLVEDIVTTGKSSRECIEAVKATGVDIVAGACLIDRSGGKADIGVPLVSLVQVEFPAYAPDKLPPNLEALPAVKPGSRHLAS